MSTREALILARHYQDVARRCPDEAHFWTARSLYYGRTAVRFRARRGGPGSGRSPLAGGRTGPVHVEA